MSSTPKRSGQALVSQAEIARALGISQPMVSKLKRQGMPVTSIRAAQTWRASRINPSRTKAALGRPAKGSPLGKEVDHAIDRKLASEANILEMRVQREREAHISLAALRADLAAHHAHMVIAAQQWVRRVAPRVTELTDAAAVVSLLEAEVHAFLEAESSR